jgi:hypothetical protein
MSSFSHKKVSSHEKLLTSHDDDLSVSLLSAFIELLILLRNVFLFLHVPMMIEQTNPRFLFFLDVSISRPISVVGQSMKMLKVLTPLLLFFSLSHSSKIEAETRQPNDFVQVIYRIIRTEDSENVKIVNFFDLSKNTSKDFSKEFYRAVGSKVTIEEAQNSHHERPWHFNVIIVDSRDQFKDIKLESNQFNYGGYYVIMFEQATRHDAHEIFALLWEFFIHNVNLIRRENGAVIVETFVPFRPSKCNQTEPVEVARFENGKFINRPDDFFPDKFDNFHGCPIKVTTFETIGPAVLRQDFANGTHRLYGRDIEIFTTIAEKLNLHAKIFYNSTYGGWGVLNAKGEGFGAFMEVKRREADVTFGNLNMKVERAVHLGFTSPYSADTMLFLVPPGRPLSTFQKLVRPFNKLLWICLCCVLAIALLTITMLQLQSRGVRDFVIGRRIRGAYLNILIALIGGSQNKLPKGNFGRFLLMNFLLFCLVLRTLYQGSLFHFLQSSDSEKEPETIQEMAVNKNYTFFMISSYKEFTTENIYLKDKVVAINPALIKELMVKLLDNKFDGSLMLKISQVLYSNRERAMNRQQLYKVCKVR